MGGYYARQTARGYSLFDVASAFQKSIRRGEAHLAVYFALELYASGFWRYAWKRLMVISAEDCYGPVTKEVQALYESFVFVNKGNAKMDRPEGRLFLAKAAILLCRTPKSRDADHAIIFIYDREQISHEEVQRYIDAIKPEERVEIPEYAYDCHTAKGRAAGKTKEDFLKSEQAALKPRQKGLFDGLVDPNPG